MTLSVRYKYLLYKKINKSMKRFTIIFNSAGLGMDLQQVLMHIKYAIAFSLHVKSSLLDIPCSTVLRI